eukprot:3098672-Rhodomonas_salina.1
MRACARARWNLLQEAMFEGNHLGDALHRAVLALEHVAEALVHQRPPAALVVDRHRLALQPRSLRALPRPPSPHCPPVCCTARTGLQMHTPRRIYIRTGQRT